MELKFRVGGYKTPKLLRVSALRFDTSVGTVAITEEGEFSLAAKGVVLQQFIGLNDTKEVEIYEGDIISVLHGLSPIPHDGAPTEWVKRPWIREVPKMGSVEGFSFMAHYGSVSMDVELQVIGNTYENPELLSGGN